MKNLEDIMKYYNLKDDDLIADEPISFDEKNRILNKTFLKAGLIEKEKKPRRKKVIVLAAACITVFALGAVTFAATALNSHFINFFQPKNQQESDLLNNLGTIIDKQVTANGLTIDIKEAVGDRNAVYVMYDIIAPEGTILDKEQYTFITSMITLESTFGLPAGMGYSFESLEDPNPQDNVKPMMLCLSSNRKLIGKNMTLRLGDFSSYKEEEELKDRPKGIIEGTPGDENDIYHILIPGTWEITFPLDYADHTAIYKLNEDLQYNDIHLKVKEVRLSPISISMTLKASSDLNSEDIHQAPLMIYLKNGDILNADNGSRGTNINHFDIVIDAQFNQILNPSEIQSIEYCGKILPIKF